MIEMVDYPALDYPEGSSLVDVRYYPYPEKFEVIFFNPILNKLDVRYEEPLIDIWFLKPDFRTNKYQIAQIKAEHAFKVITKPSRVSAEIAKEIGGEWAEWYNNNKGTPLSNGAITKHMCLCPWVFKGDFSPDVYFRLRWLNTYGRKYDLNKVTYALLDIETDILDYQTDLKDVHDVKQPVNAITLILPEQKICAVMVLGPRVENRPADRYNLDQSYSIMLNKQRVEYEWLINNQEEFKRMIREDDKDNAKYLKDYRIDLHFFECHEEINMIKLVFLYVNKYRPMFLMSWNAKFDHNYLMNRIDYLGYDPKEFFIPEEIQYKKLDYKEDDNPDATPKSSRDWFYTSTFTTYICQMRLFAMIRKSQSERRSYSLTSVGKDYAKIVKLTETKSGRFRDFAYTDFIKFILYNVRDVVVQLAIEIATNDCKSLVSRSFMFATQYSKCFQETHIVRNVREFYYEKKGFIQACRLEVPEGIDTHFQGAFVADPSLNAPTGAVVNGKYINFMIYGALDADAKSYYPSTKMGLNLDVMALLFKCIINNAIIGRYNRGISRAIIEHSDTHTYEWTDSKGGKHPIDLGAYMFNSYKNGNISYILYSYFNVMSITEYIIAITMRLRMKGVKV